MDFFNLSFMTAFLITFIGGTFLFLAILAIAVIITLLIIKNKN